MISSLDMGRLCFQTSCNDVDGRVASNQKKKQHNGNADGKYYSLKGVYNDNIRIMEKKWKLSSQAISPKKLIPFAGGLALNPKP